MNEPVALLLRRAGFGPTPAELETAKRIGYGATVSALTAPTRPEPSSVPPAPDLGLDPYSSMPNPTVEQRATADAQRREQAGVITRWWLDRMTVAQHQLTEKLMFFWHGHWATSIEKVMSPQLMLRQHLTMRHAANFADMARQLVRDPALVYFLDGHTNTKTAPNENLGRELMELFLLGIGNYTEQDVKEAGRALTGWWVSVGGEHCVFDPNNHDATDKTILGQTSDFTAVGLVDHLLRRDVCPRFIASRLWFRYASSREPIPESTSAKMVAAFPVPAAMLRELFEDEAFRGTTGKMVKQPVEWLVGAMRQLNLRPATIPDEDFQMLLDGLQSLGQVPFAPPSVGGWSGGPAWLTSAAAQVRIGMAWKLADLAGDTPSTPESLAHMLAIETWTNRTYRALGEVTDRKLFLALGLASPEYVVS